MTFIMRSLVVLSLVVSGVMAEPIPIKQQVDGIREFALRLYRELSSEDGNLFFSPYSISMAMAMTYAGAREETAQQMRGALSLAGGPGETSPMFRELDGSLSAIQGENAVAWTVANSIWPHERFAFLDEFLSTVRRDFHSEVIPVDFAQSEEARSKINEWVAGKTNRKITDLIPSGVLNALTRMVLVNAVYFKGSWETAFSPDLTSDQDFHLADSTIIRTPTMYGKLKVRIGQVEGVRLLELPYVGKRVVMVIAMPEKLNEFGIMENGLSGQTLVSWLERLQDEEVKVYLPKFNVTAQFGLTRALSALGMSDAFIEGTANFAGMDGESDNLFISDVIHKAFVEVGEEGTEAAAATGVIMQARSMPRPSPEFRADRPFVFMIMDRDTQTILFAGRLLDPR